jgi:hypothetical protein
MNKSKNLLIKSIFCVLLLALISLSSSAKNVSPSAVTPISNDDYFSTNDDVQLVANIGNNDIQSNSGNNVWSILSNPTHGIVQIQANVFIRYTPAANFNGKDTFYYKLCGNNGQCDTAMVVITINAVNDLPVAVIDRYNMDEDNVLNGNVSSNDIQSGDGGNIWTIYSNPLNGSVLLNPNGVFLYVPNPNFNGKDSFYYRLCDIDGDCSITRVVITIRPVNDLPVVVRDTFSTEENTPLISTVSLNDTLSGDGGNSFSLVNNPIHGSVLFTNTGNFTYTPFPNFSGLDSFSYRLCDANGDCKSTYAVITVNSINYFPNAIDNSYYTNLNTTLSAEVASNDTQSPDGGNTWTLVLGTSNGNLTFNNDGSFDYIPNNNFIGADTFYYSLCDINNDCSYAMVIIFVNDILPVRLLSFNANQINQSAASLQWKVDQEINVNRYEVQRSWDGLQFNTSGTLTATAEISSTKNYALTDYLETIKPLVYYRLKMVDNDGKYDYSRVITLQLNKTTANPKFSVYPNPFTSRFNLNIESKIKTDCVMNIVSTNGQKFLTKSLNLNVGLNNINVEGLSILPKGIYIIELIQNEERLSTKVIKL